MDKSLAEKKLDGMLAAAELHKRPSYRRAEVCLILGINARTFWRYVAAFELDPNTGRPTHPWALDSYQLRGHHRVRHDELVDYLARNRTYERQNAADPRQMGLFG